MRRKSGLLEMSKVQTTAVAYIIHRASLLAFLFCYWTPCSLSCASGQSVGVDSLYLVEGIYDWVSIPTHDDCIKPLKYLSHFALVLLPVMHFAFARAQVEQARPYGAELPAVGAGLSSILTYRQLK